MRTRLPLDLVSLLGFEGPTLDKLRALEAFNLSFITGKLVSEGRLRGHDGGEVEVEFKKFLGLAIIGIKPIAMMGPVVDEFWHEFLLFTAQYREFCRQVAGKFIDHQPHTLATPVPATAFGNFIDGYRRYFGEVPVIWFSGLDQATVKFCLYGTGKPPARWSGWIG
jgi:hypothetical protein